MPRIARVVLPNYPHHVVQRGHNRNLVFAEEANYRYYTQPIQVFGFQYSRMISKL